MFLGHVDLGFQNVSLYLCIFIIHFFPLRIGQCEFGAPICVLFRRDIVFVAPRFGELREGIVILHFFYEIGRGLCRFLHQLDVTVRLLLHDCQVGIEDGFQ